MLRVILTSLFAVILACPVLAHAVEINQKHRENELSCMDCHGTDSPEKQASDRACIDCHTAVPGSTKTYADRGNQLSVNVHNSHDGQLRCTLCHHIHKASELYCNDCHVFEISTP